MKKPRHLLLFASVKGPQPRVTVLGVELFPEIFLTSTDFAYLSKYWLHIVGRRGREPSEEDLGWPPENSLPDLHNGGGDLLYRGIHRGTHWGTPGYPRVHNTLGAG